MTLGGGRPEGQHSGTCSSTGHVRHPPRTCLLSHVCCCSVILKFRSRMSLTSGEASHRERGLEGGVFSLVPSRSFWSPRSGQLPPALLHYAFPKLELANLVQNLSQINLLPLNGVWQGLWPSDRNVTKMVMLCADQCLPGRLELPRSGTARAAGLRVLVPSPAVTNHPVQWCKRRQTDSHSSGVTSLKGIWQD